MLTLNEIKTPEQVEWLRLQRNDPEQFKYFRQDKPITQEQQNKWWRYRDPTRMKLFIVENGGERIGYVGFNPLNRYAKNAEFGIFITKENRGKGYGYLALKALLKYGFEDLKLASIYSETLMYPGENRFNFFAKLGFVPRENALPKYYNKQGQRIPALPFYMTNDLWERLKEPQQTEEIKRKRGRPKKCI